jgi:hypothetical protein
MNGERKQDDLNRKAGYAGTKLCYEREELEKERRMEGGNKVI